MNPLVDDATIEVKFKCVKTEEVKWPFYAGPEHLE